MDREDDDAVANILGSTWRPAPPLMRMGVPRRGENIEFDRFCDEAIDEDFDGDKEALQEMRRALWATWRTDAPRGREIPAQAEDDEDAQLARAIAESVRDSAQTSSRNTPIVVDDSDDDDAELKRILKLSEEDNHQPKRQKRDETPEEERRALAEAMAASLASAEKKAASVSDSEDEEIAKANAAFQASRQAFREAELRKRNAKTDSATPAPQPPRNNNTAPLDPAPRLTTNGVLGDRAQMEKERLARQAAKMAQTGGESSRATSSGAVVTPHVKPTPASPSMTTFSDLQRATAGPSRSAYPAPTANGSGSRSIASSYHPLQSFGPFPSDAAGEYYLDGEMRHTKLEIGNPTTERTFTPQQVIGEKHQIALIIMCTFVADDEWMEPLLPPAEVVPRIMIRPHPKEFHPAWNGKVQRQDNLEIRCYPQMVGDWGSAHMKFMWIFYKTGRLRTAIMTANMVHYDWEWIENTIFVQDFLPRRSDGDGSPVPGLGDFPRRFVDLFLHLKVHKALRHLLDHHPAKEGIPITPIDAFADLVKYDWSRVKVKLVMSVPGTYTGADKMDEFGLCRLGKVLSDNGWKAQNGEVVRAEYQGSSLGAYTIDWINDFYQYCSGKTTRSLIGRPKPISFPPVKVLFPTVATVDASLLGRDGGGTMFCGKAYNPTTKQLFHDANSKRGGVLMHAKVLVAVFEPRPNTLGVQSSPVKSGSGKRKVNEIQDENEGVGGWVYVGSHNFSSAAWGNAKLKQNTPGLTIRNYELGVVFPLPRKDTQKAVDAVVPYSRPPRPYSSTDLPWDQNTHTFSK